MIVDVSFLTPAALSRLTVSIRCTAPWSLPLPPLSDLGLACGGGVSSVTVLDRLWRDVAVAKIRYDTVILCLWSDATCWSEKRAQFPHRQLSRFTQYQYSSMLRRGYGGGRGKR